MTTVNFHEYAVDLAYADDGGQAVSQQEFMPEMGFPRQGCNAAYDFRTAGMAGIVDRGQGLAVAWKTDAATGAREDSQ
jgi:hypothetical protein